MTYVIASACIDVKDRGCVACCPVDCIYDGERMLYINPDECIDCGVCMSVCPVDAIYPERDLPEAETGFLAINRDFFDPSLRDEMITRTGAGAAGGPADHPAVHDWPATRAAD